MQQQQNLHFRSCSEQLQPMISTGNPSRLSHVHHIPELQSQNSIVREYSDSQSSLNRLFDQRNQQATVPMRERGLPASFFKPSGGQPEESSNGSMKSSEYPTANPNQRHMLANLHTRSVSMVQQSWRPMQAQPVLPSKPSGFQQTQVQYPQRPHQQPHQMNLHARSHSSIAPMSWASPQQAQLQHQPAPVVYQPQQPLEHLNGHGYFAGSGSTTNLSTATTGDSLQTGSRSSLLMEEPLSMEHSNQSVNGNGAPNNSGYFQQEANGYQPLEYQPTPSQHFHISHSQPYAPYEHSLSASSGSLGQPSLTTGSSSSSSNENNSLLGVCEGAQLAGGGQPTAGRLHQHTAVDHQHQMSHHHHQGSHLNLQSQHQIPLEMSHNQQQQHSQAAAENRKPWMEHQHHQTTTTNAYFSAR